MNKEKIMMFVVAIVASFVLGYVIGSLVALDGSLVALETSKKTADKFLKGKAKK